MEPKDVKFIVLCYLGGGTDEGWEVNLFTEKDKKLAEDLFAARNQNWSDVFLCRVVKDSSTPSEIKVKAQ